MKSSFALNGLENGEVFSDLKMLAKNDNYVLIKQSASVDGRFIMLLILFCMKKRV